MEKISVIIPTYKSPEALDLCLRSAIRGQVGVNQIIVVVDGFYDLNKEVLEKYKDNIDILDLPQNVGLCEATNLGVYNAKNDAILIVNDDNVFPKGWDEKLMENYQVGYVYSPNQIEPFQSIYPQFVIEDLGRNPITFDLDKFWDREESISFEEVSLEGSTLPIFMDKKDYLSVGGWDSHYEKGMVADLDFFLKCRLSGLNMARTYNCHFYHFVSLSVNNDPQNDINRQQAEANAHTWGKYKWGGYLTRGKNLNVEIRGGFQNY